MDKKNPPVLGRVRGPGDLMDMLGEEGTEVAKEVFKSHRFGLDGRMDGYAGPTPIERIHSEVGDFLAVLEHLIDRRRLDPGRLDQAVKESHEKLRKLFDLHRPDDTYMRIVTHGR